MRFAPAWSSFRILLGQTVRIWSRPSIPWLHAVRPLNNSMGSKRRGGTRRRRESQGNAIPLCRSAGVSFPRVGLTINAGQPKHASGVADLDPGPDELEFAEAC